MAQNGLPPDALKQVMKEALSEVLFEQRELLRDVVGEVLEDSGLVRAIDLGRESDLVDRYRIIDHLEGGA